jgi:hypothetical protein
MRWRPSQVAPALEAVRKDLSAAGMQAKAELERLQAQAAEARAAGNSSSDFASLAMNDAGLGSVGLAPSSSPSLFTPAPTTSAQTSTDQDLDEENPLTAEEKGKGREIQPETTPQQQSLFSRLQASLPANAPTSLPSLASFQSTLSSHVSSNPSLNLDIPALRQTLTSNFQKLQSDLHFSDAEKLAEEYLKKSEGLFREAGTFLQDAVKIIPPDESQGGVSWDGSDVWTLPARSNKLGSSNIVFDQSDAQVAARTGLSASSVRAQRKDALLKQLRSDRSLLMVDPAGEDAEEDVREAWKKWLETDVEGKGGIEGDEWTAKVWEELGPGGEGVEELKAMRDELGERSFIFLPNRGRSGTDPTPCLPSPCRIVKRGVLDPILLPSATGTTLSFFFDALSLATQPPSLFCCRSSSTPSGAKPCSRPLNPPTTSSSAGTTTTPNRPSPRPLPPLLLPRLQRPLPLQQILPLLPSRLPTYRLFPLHVPLPPPPPNRPLLPLETRPKVAMTSYPSNRPPSEATSRKSRRLTIRLLPSRRSLRLRKRKRRRRIRTTATGSRLLWRESALFCLRSDDDGSHRRARFL